MRFGVCGSGEKATAAVQAGYDYIEMTVKDLLRPTEDAAAFEQGLAEVRAIGLPCPVVNIFLPGSSKVTGPEVDMAALEAYVTTVMTRARVAGVDTIVFGSGGARNIPDGFDHAKAWGQLVDVCRMIAPIARDNGVTVVIEPLEFKACNLINLVSEGARLVREVDDPAIRLLVDSYHWGNNDDSREDIVANGDLLSHVHVATFPGRRPPGFEDCDLRPFFDALREVGYGGRVSFEGKTDDPAGEFSRALEVMRALETAIDARRQAAQFTVCRANCGRDRRSRIDD